MRPFNLVSPGGIGDIIIALPIIQEILKRCGQYHDFTLWTQFPEIARHFLPEITKCEKIDSNGIINLDANGGYWLSVIDLPKFGFTSTEVSLHPSMKDMFESWTKAQTDWGLLLERFPYSVNQIAQKAVAMDIHRVDLPRYILGLDCEDYKYPEQVPYTGTPFITVHDGYDTTMKLSKGYSTKNWPVENWAKFIGAFKEEFPDVKVIQIGTKSSRPLEGANTDLLGHLSWPEVMVYLHNSSCHVDGESGLVHARRLFKKPSVVMFGPTLMEYYAYPENENIASDVCFPCFWINPLWQHQCWLGDPGTPCMKGISPEMVMTKVRKVLNGKKTPLS